jgi:hypothetical protein
METPRTTVSPINTTGWAVGTRLFFVPIRFWEVQEPETGYVAEHTTFEGEIIPDGSESMCNGYGEASVYVFHDGYGHDVYMQRDRAFETREEALLYADILIAHREMQNAIEMVGVMKRIYAEMAKRYLEKEIVSA